MTTPPLHQPPLEVNELVYAIVSTSPRVIQHATITHVDRRYHEVRVAWPIRTEQHKTRVSMNDVDRRLEQLVQRLDIRDTLKTKPDEFSPPL